MCTSLNSFNYEIQDPTLEDVLRNFLDAPRVVLRNTDHYQREGAIDMLQRYACFHGGEILSPNENQMLERCLQMKAPNQRSFHQVFGPDKIPALLGNLVIFMNYEILPVASQKYVRSTCLVLEELCLWLGREGHLQLEEAEESAYLMAEAARILPRAMSTIKLLCQEAQDQSREEVRWKGIGECSSYKIARLARESVWLETPDGEAVGKLRVSEKIRRNLEPGWEVQVDLEKRQGEWKIAAVGGIYPFPGKTSA